MTGNEKSKGERCNYSGIYESEGGGVLYDLVAHLVHCMHTHMHTKTHNKHKPDMAATKESRL